jgi:hypothetical protein
MLFSLVEQVGKLCSFTSDGFTEMNITEETISFEVADCSSNTIVLLKSPSIYLLAVTLYD